MNYNKVTPEIVEQLAAIVGARHVVTSEEKMESFSHDETPVEQYAHMPEVVVAPRTAQEIAEIAKELDVPEEKSVLLRHLVLSHHGEPEFGAAVRPVCAESELLSYIDMIDSRMEIYREVLGATPLGGFSDRVFALDGKKLYHHE